MGNHRFFIVLIKMVQNMFAHRYDWQTLQAPITAGKAANCHYYIYNISQIERYILKIVIEFVTTVCYNMYAGSIPSSKEKGGIGNEGRTEPHCQNLCGQL